MDFKESLKKLRSMSDDEVVAMVEKATGKALVSYEGLDALIAALMGFYNGELKKKSPTGHKHAKEDITNFPSSMPPTAHTHDDRYDTKGEINNKLSTKVNTSDIVDNLTDNSQNKALSARQGKILNDNKLDKSDSWKITAKVIGNTNTNTDLNTINEDGFYISISSNNKWSNLPSGCSPAFELIVKGIAPNSIVGKPYSYKTQIIKNFGDNNIWIRTVISTDTSSSWGKWEKILFKEESWRIEFKSIFKPDVTLDLNDYTEAGEYASYRDIQKWKNLPPNFPNGAFNLKVIKISQGYTTQIIFSYYKPNYYIRHFHDGIISPWYRIFTDGNFNPNSKLNTSGGTISGALTVTGNIVTNGTANVKGVLTANDVYLTSDRRAKTNLKIIDNPLEKIKKINGYTFDWIKTKEKSSGVIAQEIEKILPSIVYDKGEGKKVNYNGIIALLVESNKELLKRIEILESKVR